MNSKKSQSQIITTVLLILITLSLVIIISGFAISFVKNKLSDSSCIDIMGKVEIRNNPQYTCYEVLSIEPPDGELNIQVHIGDIPEEIKGFTISISSEGSSDSYNIPEDTTNKVTMYNAPSDPLIIPQKNTEKTYTISSIPTIPDTINIYPILKDGKTCDSSDTYKFIETC